MHLHPGWVAPNDMSICSIVGWTWGELKCTPLKENNNQVNRLQSITLFTYMTARWLLYVGLSFFLHVCFLFSLNKWAKELLLLILFVLFVINACFCWVIGLLRPTTQQQIWPKLLFPKLHYKYALSVFHNNFLFGPLEPLKQGRTQLWVDRPDLLSSWTPSLAKANWMETRRL